MLNVMITEDLKLLTEENQKLKEEIKILKAYNEQMQNENNFLEEQADMNRKRRNRKPVARIDKEGNVVEYRSIQEAAKENYLERSSITKALTGKIKTAAGCEWIYLEK